MRTDTVDQNGSFDNGSTRNSFKKVFKTIFLALSWVCLVSCILFLYDTRCSSFVPATFTKVHNTERRRQRIYVMQKEKIARPFNFL